MNIVHEMRVHNESELNIVSPLNFSFKQLIVTQTKE